MHAGFFIVFGLLYEVDNEGICEGLKGSSHVDENSCHSADICLAPPEK